MSHSTPSKVKAAAGQSRRELALAVLAALLAPALLAVATWEIAREFDRGRELRLAVDHSFEEGLQLQTVFSLLQDAETGQRGYVITGDPGFLQPLEAAERRIGPAFARLEAMQSGGALTYPGKAALTVRLEELARRRIRGVRAAIRLRERQGPQAAQTVIASGRGKAVMDEIRQVVAEMSAGERRALDARSAQAAAASHSAETEITAMVVALILLLAVAYGVVLRQSHGRQKLLRQAQTAAARQTAIFESAYDSMLILNPSGTIEAMNGAAEAAFGRKRPSLERRDVSMLLDLPADDRLFLERLAAGQDLSAGVRRELTARRSDGQPFPIEATFSLIALPEGDRVVAAMRDISERRRVETMKAEFISTVSHELRTPLTSIAGSLGLLAGGAAGTLPEKAVRLLTIAHANCQRLVRLINDILDIEKLESGKMTFHMEPQDLGELARRGLDAISGMAVNVKVELGLQVQPDLPSVLGDNDRLAQVIANLLSNAVKFSPPEALVQVTVDAPGSGRVRLQVKDRGPGVPDDFRDRIFTKFAQADSSDTRRKGGTGLGLAISREIVERHGGRLAFESTPGDGATFILDLPAMSRKPALAGRPRRVSTDRAGPLRVLHVEDDADVRQVVADTLAPGCSVLGVENLAAAREALRAERPDVVILDLGLADGSGVDLLLELRQGGGPPVSVIIFSAQSLDEGALAASVDAVLTKSRMSLEQLADTVRGLARTEEGR